MDKVIGRVGYGEVICNIVGKVLAVGVDQGVFSNDLDIVLAEAICFSVKLTSETSLSPLVVESDSLWIIQFVLGKSYTYIKLFWIIS